MTLTSAAECRRYYWARWLEAEVLGVVRSGRKRRLAGGVTGHGRRARTDALQWAELFDDPVVEAASAGSQRLLVGEDLCGLLQRFVLVDRDEHPAALASFYR